MKLIIANWKMNGSIELVKQFSTQKFPENVIFCVPDIYLSFVNNLTLGAQNVSSIPHQYGAYTGEISAKMLKDIGVKYALVGHSERREYFQENNTILKQKIDNLVAQDITPIFCFGEKLEEYQSNQTLSVIENQLEPVVGVKNIILAYEPVWSIGTGIVPKKEDISKVYEFLQKKFAQMPKMVYGGSVNSDNSHEILSTWPVDGVLVGGASLKPDEFQKIIDFAS